MKFKSLHDADGARTYAVVLETGEEVTAALLAFAKDRSLDAASLTAIGALSQSKLAFFDWEAKSYFDIDVTEQVEVASMVGDIAEGHDGQPALHLHAVLGKRDGATVAGHFKSGVVRPTLEVIVREVPGHLRKKFNAELGLALIDLDR